MPKEHTLNTVIVIPARYGSTRLPGKPLVKICGQTMLARVVGICKTAAIGIENLSILVATDDQRIADHCDEIAVNWVMTSTEAPTGSDRAAEAVRQLSDKPNLVINMQGDAPLTPPDFLVKMIVGFKEQPCDAITPVTQLTWEQLDQLREHKKNTPFSGTTAVFDETTGKAHWFSKSIIPAIRLENKLRRESKLSPIYRHIGLYGYSYDMLQKYALLGEGRLEQIEGLELLRLIEHGYNMRCIPVDYNGRANMSGVDSPEDVVRAEELIRFHGELLQAKTEGIA
jgi:3-deoxy-manno-octulosonate cytidylyltransferase (CMP-KDO synthetase)